MSPPGWAVLSGFQPSPAPFAEAEEVLEEAQEQDPWMQDPFATGEPPPPPVPRDLPPPEATGSLDWANRSTPLLEGLPGLKELEATRLFKKLDEDQFKALMEQNKERARTEELDWFTDTGIGGRGRRVAEGMPFAGSISSASRLMDTALAAYEWKVEGFRTEDGARLIGEFYAELEREGELTKLDRVMELAAQMPGFFIEIGLTGGGYTAVSRGTQKILLRSLRKMGAKFLKEGIGKVGRRSLATKLAIKGAGFAVGSGALTLMNPQLIAEQTSERALHHALQGDEEAFVKAMWQGPLGAYFELSSEMSGGIGLKHITGYIAKKAGIKKMMEAAASKWLIKNPRSRLAHFLELRNKVGWHGIFEEIEEERLVDIARGLSRIDDDFGTTGRLFSADPKERSKAWEQIEIEFYAFSIVGGGMRAPGALAAFMKAPIEKVQQFSKNPSRKAWNKIERNYRDLTEEEDGRPLETAPLPIIGQTYDLPTKDKKTQEVDEENLTPQELDPKEAHHRKWLADKWLGPMAEAQLEGLRDRYKEYYGAAEPTEEPVEGPDVVEEEEEEGVLAGVEDVPEGEEAEVAEPAEVAEVAEVAEPAEVAEEPAREWQVGDTVQSGRKKAVKTGEVVRVLPNGNLEVQLPGEAETTIIDGENKTLELVSPAEAAAEPAAAEPPAPEAAEEGGAAVNPLGWRVVQRNLQQGVVWGITRPNPEGKSEYDNLVTGLPEELRHKTFKTKAKAEAALADFLSKPAAPAAAEGPGTAAYHKWKNQNRDQPEGWQTVTSFLTGHSGTTTREAALEQPGLGLLVTPATTSYLNKKSKPEVYSHIVLDNGVYGKKPFSKKAFIAMLEKAAENPEVKSRVLFVVAPDVIMDPVATLERSREYFDLIRKHGFRIAYAAQDGAEKDLESIPWDEFDVLFIGGSTAWKIGFNPIEGNPLTPTQKRLDKAGINREWMEMMKEATRRGKHIHMGRVNSAKRFGIANATRVDSVDGNFIKMGPKKNLPIVMSWLETEALGGDLVARERMDPADDPIYDELGRTDQYPEVGEPAPKQYTKREMVEGKKVKILTADGEKIDGRYALVELDDLTASHRATAIGAPFTPEGNYPRSLQPRNYDSPEERNKVDDYALKPEAGFLINDNPDATSGPPSVTPEGIVINGNGRTLVLQLSHGDWYTDALREEADHYGLSEESVDKFEMPVLVRVVDMDPAGPEAKDFAEVGNVAMTQAQTPQRMAQSMSKLVGFDMVQKLDFASGKTIAALLDGPGGRKFLDDVYHALLPQVRAQFMDSDLVLTDAGKELIRDMFLFAAFDIEVVEKLTSNAKYLKALFVNSLPTVLAIKASYPDADISSALAEAAIFISGHRQLKTTEHASEFLASGTLFGETDPKDMISPQGRMMLDLLLEIGDKPKVFRSALQSLHAELGDEREGLFVDRAKMKSVPVVISETLGRFAEKRGESWEVPERDGATFGSAGYKPARRTTEPSETRDPDAVPVQVPDPNEQAMQEAEEKDATVAPRLVESIRAYLEGNEELQDTIKEKFGLTDVSEEITNLQDDVTTLIKIGQEIVVKGPKDARAFFADVLPKGDMPAKGETAEDLDSQGFTEEEIERQEEELTVQLMGILDRIDEITRQVKAAFKEGGEDLKQQTLNEASFRHRRARLYIWRTVLEDRWAKLFGFPTGAGLGVEARARRSDPGYKSPVDVTSLGEEEISLLEMTPEEFQEIASNEKDNGELLTVLLGLDRLGVDMVQAEELEESEEDPFTYAMIVPVYPSANRDNVWEAVEQHGIFKVMGGRTWGEDVLLLTVALQEEVDEVPSLLEMSPDKSSEDFVQSFADAVPVHMLAQAGRGADRGAAEEEGLFGADPSPPRPRRPAAGEVIPEEGEPRLIDVSRPPAELPAGAVPGVHDFWTYEDPRAGSGRPIAIWKIIRRLSKLPKLFGYKGIGDFPIQTGAMKSPGALGEIYWQELMVKIRNADDMLTAFHEIGHAIEVLIFGTGLVEDPKTKKVSRTSPWKSAAVGKEVVEELRQLGVDLWGEGKKPKGGLAREGFAEFIRLYLENRADLQDKAPKAIKWFETTVAGRPNGRKALKEMNRIAGMVTGAREQGLLNWARTDLVVDPASLEVRFQEFTDMMRLAPNVLVRQFVDALQPLELFEMQYEKTTGEKLEKKKSPYMWAQALRLQHSAVVHQMVNDGMVNFSRDLVKGGVSLAQMEKFVKPKEYEDFTIYLVARRCLKLIHNEKITWDKDGNITSREPDPLETPLTELQATKIIDKLEKMHPLPGSDRGRFGAGAEIFYKWNDGVLQYVAEADPFLKEVVGRIRRKEEDRGDYAPLRRYMRTTNLALAQYGGSRVSYTDVFDRLKGSELISVVDPIQTAISNAERLILAAHNRKVVSAMISMAGGYSDKLDEPLGFGNLIFQEVRGKELKHAARVESTAKQVWSELKRMRLHPELTDDQGLPVDLADVESEAFENKMIEFYGLALTPKSGEPIIPVMDKAGNIRWYKMEPSVYQAVQSMSSDGLEFLRKNNWARWAIDVGGLLPRHTARLFRAGTVGFRASFGLVTNPLRDFQTLYLNTASSANGLTLFANFLLSFGEEFVSAITGGRVRSKWSKLWLQLGGRMALPLAQDTDLVAQSARDVLLSKNIGKRVVRYVTDPARIPKHLWNDWKSFLSFWKDFLQFPESATRMAEIRTVAAEMGWSPTMPDGKGGTQARPFTAEVMQKLILAGKQVTVDFTAAGELSRTLNTFIPFFNAAIQGPRAAVRAARRPVKMGKIRGIPTGPIHFATRGMQLAGLAIANWFQNKDEDWWIRLNAREKFLYMFYPTNILGEDVLVMIPMAHDSGQLFAGLSVAFLDAWYRREPNEVMKWTELSDFGWTIAESHSPVDIPFDFGRMKVAPSNILGKGWQTVMELGMNRKSYFGTPVVSSTFLGPGGRDRIPREQQYNEYTTEAAKWLANLAGMSPVEVDHAITSVAGPAARDYLMAGQSLDQLFTGKKLQSFSDVPILGRVFRRGGKAGTRTRPVNELYDAYAFVYTRHGDRVKSETPEENREYMLLGDATRSVSLLFHIRAMTKDETKRREISNKASELAESALDNVNTMRLERDPFRLQETMLERERNEMKMFRAYEQGNTSEGDKLRDALYKQRKNAENLLMRGFPDIEDATPAKRIEALHQRRRAAKIVYP